MIIANGWGVSPGDGIRVQTSGPHWLEVLLRGRDVGEAMGVFVFTHAPIDANPSHAHLDYMKIAFVLDGNYHFQVGDARFSCGPGGVAVIPRGAQHSFTTSTGGRILFCCAPSGNEEMFLEMGLLGPRPTSEQLAELNARFHTVGPDGEQTPLWDRMHE